MSLAPKDGDIGRLNRCLRRRRDLLLFLAAAGWLFVAWLALDVLPFRLYRRLMRPRLWHSGRSVDVKSTIARVQWAVQSAAKRVPWRAVCFHHSLAAGALLCHRGVPAELHYGVAKDEESGLIAHVWTTVGEVNVVGGAASERFAPLAVFPPAE